jgi:SOS-response transcriptional repressor LexA
VSKDFLKYLPNCFGLEVTGDGMAPGILEEDVVYVDPSQKPRGNAQDIAVLKINEAYHICRFTRYGNQILMLHDNAPSVTVRAENVEVIGKVVGGSFTSINEENQPAANRLAFA